MENIVVATDGSATAGHAVDMAARIAAALGAKLTVVHVLMHGAASAEFERMAETEHLLRVASRERQPALENVPGTMGDLFRASDDNALHARLITVMGEEVARRAADRAREFGAEVVAQKVPQGDYAEKILAASRETGADMIVMGRRGLGVFARLLQGSVSQKVSTHADCAVLTVP